MDKKYSNIVFDMSNLYHRAYAVGKKRVNSLNDGTKLSSGAVEELISIINGLLKKYGSDDTTCYFLFEGGPSSRSDREFNKRREIDPEYKSNRKHKDTVFYRGLELIELILMNYSDNFVVIHFPGYESDDLVQPLLRNIEDGYTLLVSNDMDWCRSITDVIHILKDNQIIDSNDFRDSYGFSPNEHTICMYKAFRGDKSDDIPKGVPGIREKVLVHMINEYDSLNDLFYNMESDPTIGDIWVERIKENKARLRLNYKLVAFLDVADNELSNHTHICEFNMKALGKLYESLGIQKHSQGVQSTELPGLRYE